jgi:glycosyltransferase involved in cell wall biosynthesis
MNLCFLCDEYPPLPHGGIGSRNSVLARVLRARGHTVTVVGTWPAAHCPGRDSDEVDADGIRVVRLRAPAAWWRWRPSLFVARWNLCRWLRAEHRRRAFDLIDAPDWDGLTYFAPPSSAPVTVNFAGSHVLYDQLQGRPGIAVIHHLERTAFTHASHFYAPSRWAADASLRVFGYADRACEVIPYAVDVDLFQPSPGAVEPGLIVFANSVVPRKGVAELLASVNIWAAKHPHARLLVIGKDLGTVENGRTYAERCLDIVEPQFRERVTIAGRLDRVTGVLPWLHKANVCVYPSYVETFGIAPVEAMAVGKAVINTRLGPGAEILEDGVSGLLCNPQSPEDIAAKIDQLLSDPSRAAAMGESARARVLERFNHKQWAEKHERFFEACIADFKATHRRMGKPRLAPQAP